MSQSNVTLRAMEPEDVDLLYKWENDNTLWHLSQTSKPFSRYNLEQYILSSHQDIYTLKQLRLMIDIVGEGNKTISVGCIDLYDFDPKNLRAGVGVLIDKAHRDKKVASAALAQLISYVKDTLEIHQLYCSILPDNQSSVRVFEKCGFEKTGTRKEWVRVADTWRDENFYQLIFD